MTSDTERITGLLKIAKAGLALAQAIRRNRKKDSMEFAGIYVPLPLMDMTSDEIECLLDFDRAYAEHIGKFKEELDYTKEAIDNAMQERRQEEAQRD